MGEHYIQRLNEEEDERLRKMQRRVKRGVRKMVVNGEEVLLRAGRRHDLMCCDCGLVHQFSFRRTLRGIKVIIWRDNRQTNRMRKERARVRTGI